MELTALDKVNNAIKSHTFCVQELKRKVEHELYMAESAAIAGWGTVGVLENKIYENVSGANAAEKELKTQKIRKATETCAKEQKLHMRAGPSNGTLKLRRRPKYLHGTSFKQFDGGPSQLRKPRGHDYYAPRAMAIGGQGGYRASYGDGPGGGYGGGRGRGGYGNRGPGGFGGSPKGTRTCHRLVHLLS